MRDAAVDRGGLAGRRWWQRRLRRRRSPERGPGQAGGAAGGRARLAFERGTRGAAQHERLAGARRDGVRAVPVAGARVATDERPGAAAAPARQGPWRLVDGQRHDRDPRHGRRLRPMGGAGCPAGRTRTCCRTCAAWRATRTSATGLITAPTVRSRRAAAPRTVGPGRRRTRRSALGLGYGWCEDHNAPTGTGVSPYGISARGGARVTTNDAYLEPARDRSEPAGLRRGDGRQGARRVGPRHRRPCPPRRRVGRSARAGRRPVRRRDPLSGDPAAVRHRA